MQVSAGATWYTDKGQRSYSFAVDDNDLRLLKGDEFVDALSFADLRKQLSVQAEANVISYLVQQGVLSKDSAKEKILELANG